MEDKKIIEEQREESFSNLILNKNLILAMIFLFFIGFILGQYYETKDRNSVFLLNETKLLKLVSVGLALEDKEGGKEGLTDKDKNLVKSTMKKLSVYLDEYSKHLVIIQRKNNQGYELYRGVKKIDITKDVIIKLIGEEKWKAIGKEFSQ